MEPARGRLPHRTSIWLVLGLVLFSAQAARGQLSSQDEERLKILSDPDAVKKKLEDKKNRPPFEPFKSQIAPFDVLPFVKAHHWSTLLQELRANEADYDGLLQTDPMRMAPMPLEMVFRREARLLKEQHRTLAQQFLLTKVPKEWALSLTRPGALRPDASWPVILTSLEPHQSLVLVLSKEATAQFAPWGRMTAMIPSTTDRQDARQLDRQRYYRLVLPSEPDKLALSSHPLTWSTISHVIWDGLPPDALTVTQQEALLDWIHWGGQLIFTGGAGQAYPLYKESVLGRYLPGEPTGQSVPLGENDLRPLSQSYPPPTIPFLPEGEDFGRPSRIPDDLELGRIYQRPVPMRPAPTKPTYLAVLRPAEGASTIPLGEGSPHLLAVERRVGRGRITMLTINPTEPVFATWPGIDTLVRRVVLRRPEELAWIPAGVNASGTYQPPKRGLLGAHDLSWYRITSRDAGPGQDDAGHLPQAEPVMAVGTKPAPSLTDAMIPVEEEAPISTSGVADWRDNARFPALARDLLEEASGISIPSSLFVFKVILAYLIAVVPLNWLLCRVVLRRREWAWVLVPLIALGFAIGVQRGAAYDMGFDSATDEIDLLEIQGDYPRGHLSRFASIYTSGRGNYSISYPDNTTALALPLGTGRYITGADISTSSWQSSPVPTLADFLVQPRSLSLFRAEEMTTLRGAIRLEGDGKGRKLVNDSELELRDAVLIDFASPEQTTQQITTGNASAQVRSITTNRTERYLGTIGAGTEVSLAGTDSKEVPEKIDAPGPDPTTFLRAVRSTWEPRDENSGEIRLVAWVEGARPGQVIEPPPDRRRGYTAVLVHLRIGPPPSPDGPRYFQPDRKIEDPTTVVNPNLRPRRPSGRTAVPVRKGVRTPAK